MSSGVMGCGRLLHSRNSERCACSEPGYSRARSGWMTSGILWSLSRGKAMAVMFNREHLEFFRRESQIGKWRERDAAPWTRSVGIEDLSRAANAKPLTRVVLKELASATTAADRDVLWATLAWGGMRRDAARRLALNEVRWTAIVGRLRRDGLDRQSSYEICSTAANSVRAGGIGPAYFTKLIFFANPQHEGYIMDQWTSRSINFLVDGPPIVRMRTRDHVDPRNDAATYERFCLAIEQLSDWLEGKDAEFIEQCLFSTGGRKPAPWRSYLLEQGG